MSDDVAQPEMPITILRAIEQFRSEHGNYPRRLSMSRATLAVLEQQVARFCPFVDSPTGITKPTGVTKFCGIPVDVNDMCEPNTISILNADYEKRLRCHE